MRTRIRKAFYSPRSMAELVAVFLALTIVSSLPTLNSSAEAAESQPTEKLTRSELQSLLMSFADRYIAVTDDYYHDFMETKPALEERQSVTADTINSYFDVITIAASPNPEVALLDLVISVTLKRMVYEEHWRKVYGTKIDVILAGMKLLEEEIWDIAGKVLTQEQQAELMKIIRRWRKEHPDILTINWLRFADFAEKRFQSDFVKMATSGLLLPELDKANQQIEESRLIAERAMYLASRYPLLYGIYSDLVITLWLQNPEVRNIVGDLHAITESSRQFGDLAEKIPELIRNERAAAIDHLMDRLAKERKEIIRQLAEEEKRLGGLLGELRQTVTAADALVQSSDALAKRFGVEPDTPSTFDINDYRRTIEEATVAIKELGNLLERLDHTPSSAKWDKFFPVWVKYFDDVENTGTNLIDYALIRAFWLIIISMVVFVLATLVIRFVTRKYLDAK